MDRLFDKLGDALRSFLGDTGRDGSDFTARRSADPDLAAAWDELDAYLRDDVVSTGGPAEGGSRPPESLRGDYTNLEVPFGAPLTVVQESYRKLIVRYHPDRNATDPDRLRMATEITKKINSSYQRIQAYEADRTSDPR